MAARWYGGMAAWRTLLYHEIPTYFTWNNATKLFARRKMGQIISGHDGVRKADTFGRVYTVHVRNFECFCLRLLLNNVRGPTSFENIRTVNGVICETFHDACLKLGLLENDQQWDETLKEAAETEFAGKIRTLFAIMLSCCEISNPQELWEKHREAMSEDLLYNIRNMNPNIEINFNNEIYNQSLILIENQVIDMCGKYLDTFGMKKPDRQITNSLSREIIREKNYNMNQLQDYVHFHEPLLNADQKKIFDQIIERNNEKKGGIIFIDAPGGTGKTFLFNLLLAKIRQTGKIALAIASSGKVLSLQIIPSMSTNHSYFFYLNRDRRNIDEWGPNRSFNATNSDK